MSSFQKEFFTPWVFFLFDELRSTVIMITSLEKKVSNPTQDPLIL